MISSQLAAILHEHLRRNGGADTADPDAECAVLFSDDRLTVTVASVPDAATVMLFAEAARLPRDPAWSIEESQWTTVDDEDDDPFDDDDAPAFASGITLLHDEQSGAVALTDSAPVDALDAVTFEHWVRRFVDEVVEMVDIVAEVATEAESAAAAYLPNPWVVGTPPAQV